MNCDFIRDLNPTKVNKERMEERVRLRNSEKHRSHEILQSVQSSDNSRDGKYGLYGTCDRRLPSKMIKTTNKRNSRSEENLLDLSRMLAGEHGGVIRLSQEHFMSDATKQTSGEEEQQQSKKWLKNNDDDDKDGGSEPRSRDEDSVKEEESSRDDIDGNNSRKGDEDEDSHHKLDFTALRKKLTIDEKMMPPLQSPNGSTMTDAQGLIVPKKLINPCLESSDRQNLHRELLFNQKMGRSVLNQKSELQRVLEKQKERQFIAAQQQQQSPALNCKDELGRVIMQRAQRLESMQNGQANNDEDLKKINPEYVNARAKLKATTVLDGK